jgi:hypothetical protein
MELLLPQSRWPEANCASCFQNNPCLHTYSPHTLQKIQLQKPKQKQAHGKKKSPGLWHVTCAAQPGHPDFFPSLFCSVRWAFLSFALFDLLNGLWSIYMAVLTASWTLLHPILMTPCSPGPCAISLASQGFIFTRPPLLHSECFLACPAPCYSSVTLWYRRPHGTCSLLLQKK